MNHAERGQAILETVIFLPMFLLALFGVIWAVQMAVQYERSESAVRYAGMISQNTNPYTNYSLYAMFTQLGSTTLPTLTCVTPLTDPLTDAAPTYSSSQTTTASPSFWAPTSPTPACSTPDSAGIVGIAAGTGLNQDVLFSEQYPQISLKVAVPPYLQSTLGTLSSIRARERFFAPVGINTILACYATLNAQINNSIYYATDTSTATAPTALGSTVTPIALAPSASCTSF